MTKIIIKTGTQQLEPETATFRVSAVSRLYMDNFTIEYAPKLNGQKSDD